MSKLLLASGIRAFDRETGETYCVKTMIAICKGKAVIAIEHALISSDDTKIEKTYFAQINDDFYQLKDAYRVFMWLKNTFQPTFDYSYHGIDEFHMVVNDYFYKKCHEMEEVADAALSFAKTEKRVNITFDVDGFGDWSMSDYVCFTKFFKGLRAVRLVLSEKFVQWPDTAISLIAHE